MPPLARRNLFHDKIRLAVTLTGIVLAVVLVVVELGLFVGFTLTTSSLIESDTLWQHPIDFLPCDADEGRHAAAA